MKTNRGIFRKTLTTGLVISSRDSEILRVSTGKRVLHIGCVDRPFMREKLSSGDLLHAKLCAAGEVLGIDTDQDGIHEMKGLLGGKYLQADVQTLNAEDISAIEEFRPEVLLVPDTIEHVHDQISFMQTISLLSARFSADIVLTTPNALSFRTGINTLLGFELMHPDHLLVHTPTTLKSVLTRSNLHVLSWHYYRITTGHGPTRRLYDTLASVPARVRPAWSDGHLVVARAVG